MNKSRTMKENGKWKTRIIEGNHIAQPYNNWGPVLNF